MHHTLFSSANRARRAMSTAGTSRLTSIINYVHGDNTLPSMGGPETRDIEAHHGPYSPYVVQAAIRRAGLQDLSLYKHDRFLGIS